VGCRRVEIADLLSQYLAVKKLDGKWLPAAARETLSRRSTRV
jgi:hypothetical protein